MFDFYQGNVYVKCPSIPAAMAAVSALHGRWFGGNSDFSLAFDIFLNHLLTVLVF